jgi:hypothetical protein
MRIQILLAGAAMALGLAAQGAAAATLYGATYTGATSDLYRLDQTTGAATLVGATGQNIGDMTNVGQSLVGIDLTNNALWTLNASTGAASNEVSITGTRGTITSIAWDAVSHVLYGDTTDAFSGSDLLYSIDAGTGAATLVGSLGATNLFGLGFSRTGDLFASDASDGFYGVSISTGAASLIGHSGFTTYDLAARPGDNAMFGAPGGSELLRFNTATGGATSVGSFGGNLNIAGLAFLGGVPEPASWALMITGFGLAGVTLRARRKAEAAAAA